MDPIKLDDAEYDTPQRDMFYRIRVERNGKCEATGKVLHEPLAYYFAHVLPKGLYPNYKYEPRNVIMVSTMALHATVDSLRSWHYGEIEERLIAGERITFNRLKRINAPSNDRRYTSIYW